METENGGDFSKLEAGFAHMEIARRRVSLQLEEAWRHAKEADVVANDLDFNSDVNPDSLPPNLYPSLQGIYPALQYSSHLDKPENFAEQTKIECFDLTDDRAAFHTLNSAGLDKILDEIKLESPDIAISETASMKDKPTLPAETCTSTNLIAQTPPPTSASTQTPVSDSRQCSQTIDTTLSNTEALSTTKAGANGRLLVFFVPLLPNKESSFASQAMIKQSSAQKLFNTLGANPEFLLNMLGRPDYWSPRTRWQCDIKDQLIMCDYFCQHPRWNTQFQGAPLSVYMMRRVKEKLTAYIISHKVGDSSVQALQQILKAGVNLFGMENRPSSFLTNPFEIAVLLSSLSLEASKFYLGRFRRYMWEQINKVDDHLAGLEVSDRARLTELTKRLQIISQQADSHLLNANVAIITATGIRDAQAKFHDQLSTPMLFRQSAEDAIKYVIDSMEKQKMLFLNYKSRKDGTMGLVYNLVTQSDAANNIQLSKSMKRDSTSMSAIATLTMVFLPGTFTSSILSAGIFSAGNSNTILTTNLWWFWAVLTFPLTIVVVFAWWIYKRRSDLGKSDSSERDLQDKDRGVWLRFVSDKITLLYRTRRKTLDSHTKC